MKLLKNIIDKIHLIQVDVNSVQPTVLNVENGVVKLVQLDMSGKVGQSCIVSLILLIMIAKIDGLKQKKTNAINVQIIVLNVQVIDIIATTMLVHQLVGELE